MNAFDTAMRPFHEEWLEQYAEFRSGKFVAESGVDPEEPAAPHLPVVPDGYDPDRIASVLLVGRCPRGPFTPDDEAPAASYTPEDCYGVTRDVVARALQGGHPRSAFWRFAMNLSAVIAERTSTSPKPVANLVWSNVVKIAAVSPNAPPPKGNLWFCQEELAGKTLAAEIATYRPAVVVIATGAKYRSAVKYGLARFVPDIESYEPIEARGWPATNIAPAIFWYGHPERKPADLVASWVTDAVSLVTSK